MFRLRPSDIHYSQDSINNYFDAKCKHSEVLIGQTLDDICEGRISINAIPSIMVVHHYGQWVTADNRRLWVFRQLERLGKCTYIYVYEGYCIPTEKLTSTNDGVTVRVRGHPGSYWLSRSASLYDDNTSLYRNVYDANTARPYSSNYSRTTPHEYPVSSYATYESFNGIFSNSYTRSHPEPLNNVSWCETLFKMLCIMLILVIVLNVFKAAVTFCYSVFKVFSSCTLFITARSKILSLIQTYNKAGIYNRSTTSQNRALMIKSLEKDLK